MKNCTDLDQSRKLAEFLPLESADMVWANDNDVIVVPSEVVARENVLHDFVPCWSLAALFSMLPKSAYLEKGSSTELCRVTLPVELISSDWNLEPVNACVEVMEKLHEQKLL